ncbi:MAG: 23S rRNA (guanosine(2251)-2'-O)-methyltransferase RlmB [Prolixibacteraceae bacterium]|nr:23S rRNA (guanosine(2251)-2'-O)-methyltransferase RlmB [Prolixibacteraceae bacterium]
MNNDFIFGIRAVIEAIHSGKNIDKILVRKGLQGELFQELDELIASNRLHYQLVPEEKLNRITRKNHQGVIAFISPVTFFDYEEMVTRTFEQGETPFFLFLDQITDVRNFGAIVRSAECAGVHAIVIPEKGSAQINADAVKTSAGALHYVPVCKVKNAHKTVSALKQLGMKVFAVTEKGNKAYYSSNFSVPCVLVMGSEESGISTELLALADEMINIPLLGKIGSLNVSVATGIILFEVVKQRIQ